MVSMFRYSSKPMCMLFHWILHRKHWVISMQDCVIKQLQTYILIAKHKGSQFQVHSKYTCCMHNTQESLRLAGTLTTLTPITVSTGPAKKANTNASPTPRKVPRTSAEETDGSSGFLGSLVSKPASTSSWTLSESDGEKIMYYKAVIYTLSEFNLVQCEAYWSKAPAQTRKVVNTQTSQLPPVLQDPSELRKEWSRLTYFVLANSTENLQRQAAITCHCPNFFDKLVAQTRKKTHQSLCPLEMHLLQQKML